MTLKYQLDQITLVNLFHILSQDISAAHLCKLFDIYQCNSKFKQCSYSILYGEIFDLILSTPLVVSGQNEYRANSMSQIIWMITLKNHISCEEF